MRLSVIFENVALKGFVAAWGLSIFVETDWGNRLLFDTGSSGCIWKHNAALLNVDYDSFEHVFISHFHWDHIGAALDIAKLTKREKHFILPLGVSRSWITELTSQAKISLAKEPYRFGEEFFSLGSMDTPVTGLYEQALVVFNRDNTYTLMVGCSHPSIERIVKRAVNFTQQPPKMVIGGFHLIDVDMKTAYRIALQLKNIGVEYIAPCHCSRPADIVFKEVFKEKFIPVAAGTVIEIP